MQCCGTYLGMKLAKVSDNKDFDKREWKIDCSLVVHQSDSNNCGVFILLLASTFSN
jgi:hypothetical protein